MVLPLRNDRVLRPTLTWARQKRLKLLAMDWIDRHAELDYLRDYRFRWYTQVIQLLSPDEALRGRNQHIVRPTVINMRDKAKYQTRLCMWRNPCCCLRH